MFLGARCDGPIPGSMEKYNVHKTPSWGLNSPTVEDLINYVEEAKEKGTIAVFMFHSVGGGYLNVGAEEHRKLLEYVHENKDVYYTGSFLEVMNYIDQHR